MSLISYYCDFEKFLDKLSSTCALRPVKEQVRELCFFMHSFIHLFILTHYRVSSTVFPFTKASQIQKVEFFTPKWFGKTAVDTHHTKASVFDLADNVKY